MRMNKKKSSLALALVALLTVVGIAWAANLAWPGTLHVFDYSNTYSTGISGTTTGGAKDYFSVTATLIPTADYNTPGEALAAATKGPNNDMSVATVWGTAGDLFSANKLSVSSGTVT